MSGPFKMKGSPMKRNFGIGASPVKQTAKPSDEEWDKMTSKEKDDYIYKDTPGGNPYTNPKDEEFYGKKTGGGYEKAKAKETE